MQKTTYHSVLRVAALSLALVLLFVSGIVDPITRELSHSTGQYVAQSVGASAEVPATELNSLSSKLAAERRALAEREAALAEREIAVTLNSGSGPNDRTTYILSVILFIMLVLIILNYGLDYARAERVGVVRSSA